MDSTNATPGCLWCSFQPYDPKWVLCPRCKQHRHHNCPCKACTEFVEQQRLEEQQREESQTQRAGLWTQSPARYAIGADWASPVRSW